MNPPLSLDVSRIASLCGSNRDPCTIRRLWTITGSGPHQDGVDPSDTSVIHKDSTQKALYYTRDVERLFDLSTVHANIHHHRDSAIFASLR